MDCIKRRRQDKKAQPQLSGEPQFQSTEEITSNFDLIPVFPNEITLGPLMGYIPWYIKPLLMTLNRTWAYALNNPFYAPPQYKPYALRNSAIFYVYTQTGNDKTLTLRIYHEGILRRLPLPHIPAESFKFTRFFVTDQCVYALTPAADIHTYNYNINMLHLGGGITKWQTLPPLPNIGECVYISSIISEDGNSTHDYMWMRDNDICIAGLTEEYIYLGQRVSIYDADDWSEWKLHTTSQNGRCRNVPPPPPPPPAPPLENFENQPPEYLDIYETDQSRRRHLYKLFTACEHTLQLNRRNIIEPTVEPGFLLVFKDDYEGTIKGVNCIRKQVNTDGSIKLLLYRKSLQNTEALKGEELNEFYKSWRIFLSNRRFFLPEQLSAAKTTADLSERMDGWKKQFSLPSNEGDGLVLNERSTIKVAQQGTMYIYAYIATKCTDMYLQGEEHIPFP